MNGRAPLKAFRYGIRKRSRKEVTKDLKTAA